MTGRKGKQQLNRNHTINISSLTHSSYNFFLLFDSYYHFIITSLTLYEPNRAIVVVCVCTNLYGIWISLGQLNTHSHKRVFAYRYYRRNCCLSIFFIIIFRHSSTPSIHFSAYVNRSRHWKTNEKKRTKANTISTTIESSNWKTQRHCSFNCVDFLVEDSFLVCRVNCVFLWFLVLPPSRWCIVVVKMLMRIWMMFFFSKLFNSFDFQFVHMFFYSFSRGPNYSILILLLVWMGAGDNRKSLCSAYIHQKLEKFLVLYQNGIHKLLATYIRICCIA